MVYLDGEVKHRLSVVGNGHIRFSCSGLSICKQRAVVTLKDLLQHGADDVVVEHGLVRFRSKYQIEWVCSRRGLGDDSETRLRRSCFD